MMRQDTEKQVTDADMRAEYDFSGGERGTAYRPLDRGYVIREEHPDGTVTVTQVPPRQEQIVLDPDVKEYFPDSEAVNRALRAIITLFPSEQSESDQSKRKPAASRNASTPRMRQAKAK